MCVEGRVSGTRTCLCVCVRERELWSPRKREGVGGVVEGSCGHQGRERGWEG